MSRQGSRRKAAQTSSVAARLTAVQPTPEGSCGTCPRWPLTWASRGQGQLRGRSNAAYLPRVPSAKDPLNAGPPAGRLSQARKLADVSVPVSGHSVKGCAAGRARAASRRARPSDHTPAIARLDRLCRSGGREPRATPLAGTMSPKTPMAETRARAPAIGKGKLWSVRSLEGDLGALTLELRLGGVGLLLV